MNIIKGTGEWAIIHLKSIGLPRLIDDLESFERSGYNDTQCRKVVTALAQIISDTQNSTGSFWSPQIVTDLENLLQIYESWNGRGERSSPEDIYHRRVELERLRDILRDLRRKLNRKRDSTGFLYTEEDTRVAIQAYRRLENLVLTSEKDFRSLKAAIKAFKQGVGDLSSGM